MSSATSWRYGYLQQRPACFGLSTVPLPPAGSSSRRQKLGSRLSSSDSRSLLGPLHLPLVPRGSVGMSTTRARY